MTAEDGQIPVLCRSCGGRAVVVGVEIRCPYCGSVEPLPADRASFVADLRMRLTVSASACAQATGSLRALSATFERPLASSGAIAVLFLVGLTAFVLTILSDAVLSSRIPEPVRVSVIVGQLSGPIWFLSVPASLAFAWFVGRWRYRKTVRPWLLARAPRFEGQAARCRACGGDLPSVSTPDVRCRYCGTESLVGRELFAERARFLDDEKKEYLARARGVVTRSRKISRWVTVVTVLSLVFGVVVTASLLGVADALSAP